MFEALEARRLMSAVATFADGGKATQSGSGTLHYDGADNVANNVAVVENLAGTLGDHNFAVINLNTGEFAFFYNVNATKPVTISGGHSNDTLLFNGQTTAASITGGSGNDFITISDTRNGPVTVQDFVDAGKGNDNIELVASPKATLNGGDGDDVFNINTGAIDNALLYDYDAATITVNAGAGNDTIYIYDGKMKLDGGSGSDTLVDLSSGSASYSYKNVESVVVA